MFKVLGRAALLLVIAIQLSGCSAAVLVAGGAAGAGGIVWVKGKLKEQLDSPLTKVHEATITVLKAFELRVEKDMKDKLAAKVESRFADGKRLWIDIRSISESLTEISIRIGVFGNKARSERILRKIREYL